jgi:hypothetical protein
VKYFILFYYFCATCEKINCAQVSIGFFPVALFEISAIAASVMHQLLLLLLPLQGW